MLQIHDLHFLHTENAIPPPGTVQLENLSDLSREARLQRQAVEAGAVQRVFSFSDTARACGIATPACSMASWGRSNPAIRIRAR